MESILVTLKRAGEVKGRDLELPLNMPTGQLAIELAELYGWNLDNAGYPILYELEAHPPGRRLNTHETLAQSQVWDGSLLVLHAKNTVQPQPPSPNSYTLTRLD